MYRSAPVLHTSVRCIYIPFCACFTHFSSLYLYTALHLFFTLQFAVFVYRFAPVLHTSVRCIYIPFCACFSHFSSLYLYTALHLFFTLQVAVFIYRFAPVFHTSGRCIYSTAGQATDDNIKRRMRIAC